MAKVVWSPQSIEDIEQIAQFIAKDSIKYAQTQVSNILASTKILAKFPKSGALVPELNNSKIRQIVVGYYRVIYRVSSPKQIDILTVYHTKRHLEVKFD